MIERYARPDMKKLWSDEAKFSYWAKVERAHLETLHEQKVCPSVTLDAFDRAFASKTAADFLRREEQTGHDVIAFVSEVGDAMGDDGRFLHRGLTSSDILDSSLALRLVASLQLLGQTIFDLQNQLQTQAFRYAKTPCIARTHGIHAEPISFGQILASHYAELARVQNEIETTTEQIRFGKLSGAVGHYSQLSPIFEKSVLDKLGLKPETVATQVIPRDRHVKVAFVVLSASNAIERLATNIRHWARTEVGEVFEPFSKTQKGSSAMPHKRNPILSENLCGLARTIRGYFGMVAENTVLWHERDISNSSVERIAFPDMFVTCDFMCFRMARLIENMVVLPQVMLKNLDKTGGLWCSQSVLTALTEHGMNRTQAYELVQKIAFSLSEKTNTSGVAPDAFLNALKQNEVVLSYIPAPQLEALFCIDRFLESVPVVFGRCFGENNLGKTFSS